jgi:hypothetical protein
MEHYSLGPSPVDEECVQVGSDNYLANAQKECKRYMELLEKKFDLLDGMYFQITYNAHDFGTYLDVEVFFNENDEEQLNYASYIEDNLPFTWED